MATSSFSLSKLCAAMLVLWPASADAGPRCTMRDLLGTWQMAVVQTQIFEPAYTEHLTCFLELTWRARNVVAAVIDCKNMCVGCGSWYSEPREFEMRISGCSGTIWEPSELRLKFSPYGFGQAQGEIPLAVAGVSSPPVGSFKNTITLVKVR